MSATLPLTDHLYTPDEFGRCGLCPWPREAHPARVERPDSAGTVKEQLWQLYREAGYDFIRAGELATRAVKTVQDNIRKGRKTTLRIGKTRVELAAAA